VLAFERAAPALVSVPALQWAAPASVSDLVLESAVLASDRAAAVVLPGSGEELASARAALSLAEASQRAQAWAQTLGKALGLGLPSSAPTYKQTT
jgi:hypothetical protein